MADAGDGGEVVSALAGDIVLVERTAAVHFKGDGRIFAQNVELTAFACAVAEERERTAFTGIAEIQRQKIRLSIVYHGKMDHFTIVDNGENFAQIGDLAVASSHGRASFDRFPHYTGRKRR